ncbi:hypothetical protein RJ640_011852 [Escallonia rubra]|uniref:FBD domain-containing protein n=1 Tax=Escallonia rubra TaxID=112253 RepID=A0AA88UIL4_9ASTE|nr:hypothetical protein RJ640_011852 [Escallonia rubra]
MALARWNDDTGLPNDDVGKVGNNAVVMVISGVGEGSDHGVVHEKIWVVNGLENCGGVAERSGIGDQTTTYTCLFALKAFRTLEVGYLYAHKEEAQLKLIKYFLKNAKVLEDVSISCPEYLDTTQIQMKLFEFPRGSSLLRFSTIEDSD